MTKDTHNGIPKWMYYLCVRQAQNVTGTRNYNKIACSERIEISVPHHFIFGKLESHSLSKYIFSEPKTASTVILNMTARP